MRKTRFMLFTLALWGVLTLFIPLPLLAQDAVLKHVVQPGENLFRIALRYGINTQDLISANNIADPRRIFAGQELIIPGLSPADSGDTVANPLVASIPTIHVVQRGETLSGIAKQYNMTLEQIMQSNNISNPNRILRGQQLQVWTLDNTADQATIIPEETIAEAANPPRNETNITYIVQPGEHLALIAQRYGVSWPVIAQLNGINDPNRVFAGQELLIPALNALGGVNDLGILNTTPPHPGATIIMGKQIIVDLSDSRIYAYQDGQLVRNVLVSTGLPATPTVRGDFKVYVKYTSQTMSGPGYRLPGVPWVMYFYQGYGIHGTYWHSNFGQPMSRGCVNLPTPEAEWFFNWAEVGTPVRVQL